jgi:predicted nucleotidyltransferase
MPRTSPLQGDKVKSTQEVVSILRRAKPLLAREYGVTRIAVFGSYARGEQREGSDVDVLVEVPPAIGMRFVDLAERIEALLGIRSEVVSRRAIPPRHWAIIESELLDVA